jgi:transposase
MLTASDSVRVYLACGATDMRKSMDGLAAIVTYSFRLDPFDTSLFVFCNKGRDKLKILVWDHNGFWLHYRRLERGRFQWPSSASSGALVITRRQLTWLLDGLSIDQRSAHSPVTARVAA